MSGIVSQYPDSEGRTDDGGRGVHEYPTIGKYRIIGVLGEGSMGKVYAAEDSVLGRQAAIKVLRPERALNREAIEDFIQEARAASAIEDPGIIKIYEVCEQDNGAVCLIMEHLQGETLASRLHREGALGLARARPFVVQIANALKAANRHGIVHRDLKPANLFITRDPQVVGGERIKILDFGIAKVAGEPAPTPAASRSPESTPSRAHTLLGSPAYMAPEQCRHAERVDHRADLYALGCIFFEMLCGQPPFVHENSTAVILGHLNQPPSPPSKVASERMSLVGTEGSEAPTGGASRSVAPTTGAGKRTRSRKAATMDHTMPFDPRIDQVVLKLLAKKPDERYQDTDTLIQDLATLATSPPRAPFTAGSMGQLDSNADMSETGSGTRSGTTGMTLASGVPRLFTTMVAAPRRRPVMFSSVLVSTALVALIAMLASDGTSGVTDVLGSILADRADPSGPGYILLPPKPEPTVRLLDEDLVSPDTSDDEILARVRADGFSSDAILWIIKTEPPGAEVYFSDGTRVAGFDQVTPLALEYPDKVERADVLTIKMMDHEDVEIPVRFDEDVVIRQSLVQIPRVTVRTEPTGCTVLDADGEDVGKTPWLTSVSRRSEPRMLTLRCHGYHDHVLQLRPGMELSEPIALERLPEITFNTEPTSALILDDQGRELGRTPWTRLAPSRGHTMTVTLTLPEYEDRIVTVVGGQELPEVIELTPIPRVTVRTRRSGVSIRDASDQEIARTPWTTLVPRDSARRELFLVKDGHEKHPIVIEPGCAFDEAIELTPWAEYRIRTSPRRTTIHGPDGAELGRTPKTLRRSRALGPLQLTFRGEGHVDQTLIWRPGEPTPAVVALTPLVEVRITSRQRGATVLDANGKVLGQTPWKSRDYPLGDEPLYFTVQRDGYKSRSVEIVPRKRRNRARVVLQELPPPPPVVAEATPTSEQLTPLDEGQSEISIQTVGPEQTGGTGQTVAASQPEGPPLPGTPGPQPPKDPSQVTLEIKSDPPGAVVEIDGEVVGKTPHSFTVRKSKRKLEVTLSHKRHRKLVIKVPRDRDRTFREALVRCTARTGFGSGLVDPYECKD